jgi:hypothetical protein
MVQECGLECLIDGYCQTSSIQPDMRAAQSQILTEFSPTKRTFPKREELKNFSFVKADNNINLDSYFLQNSQ